MFASALLLAVAAGCIPLKNVCEVPVSSDSIADSVGMNIHLHYQDTRYDDFPLVRDLLVELGVRHTRDGLVDTKWQQYYQRHMALGRLGIKCLFITSPGESEALLTSWPSRVAGAFEGFEAPNEYDRSGDPGWDSTLGVFMRQLHIAVKSNPSTTNFPIVGPSLTTTSSYVRMKGMEKYFTFANLHNYFGGHNPDTAGWGDGGYGSISYNIENARNAWPDVPIWTTETGYLTDPSLPQGVPELVAGKYVPRLILDQAMHGVARTYLYELMDEGMAAAGNSGAYGLVRGDGSRKPSFFALKNLIGLLSDPGPQETSQNLMFSILGPGADLQHLLMAKRDGSYYLAYWLDKQAYDLSRHTTVEAKSKSVECVFKRRFDSAKIVVFNQDGSISDKYVKPTEKMSLTATDSVSILILR